MISFIFSLGFPTLSLSILHIYSTDYNWKPTLPVQEVPSLIDTHGYFLSSIDDILYKANPEEMRKELINQIIIAQKSGINVSHIDSHMGVLLHKKLFPLYRELADLFKIQPFIVKSKPGDTKGNRFHNCDEHIDNLANQGFKVIDNFDANSLYQGEKRYNIHCAERIKSVATGTTYFLVHALDNMASEYEKTPDYVARQYEYDFFKSDMADDIFKRNHIKKITMKEI